MVGRLSIFNSKKIIFLYLFLFISFLGIIEFLYFQKNVPYNRVFKNIKYTNVKNSDIGIILGDSRAKLGINPEFMSGRLGVNFFNISRDGGDLNDQLIEIIQSGIYPKILIISVSPASIFGNFVKDELNKKNLSGKTKILVQNHFQKYKLIVKDFMYMNDYLEPKLKNFIYSKFRFTYGFSGLNDLLRYGTVSEYNTDNGWRSILRLGSDEKFTRILNYYSYKDRIFKRANDTVFITNQKFVFEKLLSLLNDKTKIVVVRIPTSKIIYNIEKCKYPWFDKFMYEICYYNKVLYLNSWSEFKYDVTHSDYSHLSRYDAEKFTEFLTLILEYSSQNKIVMK